MIRRLKSHFNRARVNHPTKTYGLGIAATGSSASLAAGLFLAPIDGGATLILLSTGTFMGTVVGSIHGMVDNDYHPHHKYKNISHNGKKYTVTEAQEYHYKNANRKLRNLKTSFQNASDDRKARRIEKKMQRVMNFMDDIIDSKTVQPAGQPKVTRTPNVSFKDRSPGN